MKKPKITIDDLLTFHFKRRHRR
uniref:Uncharacterized protein n=1 Tax=Rhizophora mucronata TaxID=61149 RepID=A0A2P2R324_RHIMU